MGTVPLRVSAEIIPRRVSVVNRATRHSGITDGGTIADIKVDARVTSTNKSETKLISVDTSDSNSAETPISDVRPIPVDRTSLTVAPTINAEDSDMPVDKLLTRVHPHEMLETGCIEVEMWDETKDCATRPEVKLIEVVRDEITDELDCNAEDS